MPGTYSLGAERRHRTYLASDHFSHTPHRTPEDNQPRPKEVFSIAQYSMPAPPAPSNTHDAASPSCGSEGARLGAAVTRDGATEPTAEDNVVAAAAAAGDSPPGAGAATFSFQREADATLSTSPDNFLPNDLNDMGLVGLLLRGMQHRSASDLATASQLPITLTAPHPSVARDTTHPAPRGSYWIDEEQSRADPAPRAATFEARPAAIRLRRNRRRHRHSLRRRDGAVAGEAANDHPPGRSVRLRALRALLEDVIGEVSADALGDGTIDRGDRRE